MTVRQQGLDVVRGIAILSVLLFHFPTPVGIASVDAILTPFRTAGWAGVELFFVLSGFLVGGIIMAESEAAGGFDWRRFIMRRALRLWPVLYLYVALLAYAGTDWSVLWPTLVHGQNFNRSGGGHLWSLAVEEHFYLGAALILPFLIRGGSPNRLMLTLVAVILTVNALRPAMLALGTDMATVHHQTQFRIDGLAAGVLLAAVRRYRPQWFAAAQAQRPLLILASVAGFAVLALAPDMLSRWSLDLTLAWLAAAPLVIAASDLTVRGPLARPARALAWLGLIAYPLYIWHISAGNIAGTLAEQAGVADPAALAIVRLASAIAFAALLHRAVEQPFMMLRDRIELRKAKLAIKYVT